MSEKSASTIAIIALIIGILAGATAVYALYNVNGIQIPSPSGIQDIYTLEDQTYYYTNPITPTFVPVNNLNITFEVGSGETVFFFYSGLFVLLGPGSEFLHLWFSIDGVRVPEVKAAAEMNVTLTAAFSVSLSYYNNTLTPGTHNVSVIIRGTDTSNSIRENLLMVQTII